MRATTYPVNAIVVIQNPSGYSSRSRLPDASHVIARPIAIDAHSPATGRAVSVCAVAAGTTSSANTRSEPVIWLAAATAIPDHDEEHDRQEPDRHAAGQRDIGIDRREQQRARDCADDEHRRRADDEQRHDLRVGDTEEAPEQQRAESVGEPAGATNKKPHASANACSVPMAAVSSR